MNLSLNFVKDYMDLDNELTVKDIAEAMTKAGNEYDSAEKLINATKLVIGEIKECEMHPDSDHLHLCKVDIGSEILNIVCGAPNARKGIKVTYCTDSRPVKSISENAKDSDLFICEGMYGEAGKEAKAKEYKHMTFKEAAMLAKEANVKEMWLTHYSPSLVRPIDYIDSVKGIFPNTIAGTDGKSVELVFED